MLNKCTLGGVASRERKYIPCLPEVTDEKGREKEWFLKEGQLYSHVTVLEPQELTERYKVTWYRTPPCIRSGQKHRTLCLNRNSSQK